MACPFAITNTTANAGPCEELQCAPGTSGSQSCQPCAPPSHYQPLGGQTMCLNTTLCRPGFVEEQPPTPTTDRVCVACGHGTFSNVTADGAGSCVNWRTCAVLTEQYILGDGTSSTDRACAALTPCTPSQFEQQPPTRFHDRVCANISAPCDVGSTEYEAAQSTATSDRVCRPIRHCNVTQFELASPASTSNRQCQACRACAGDEVEVRPCTLTQDRACEELRIVLLRPDNGSTIPSNRFVVEANANGQFVPPVGQLQPSLPPNTSIVFVQPAMSTTNSISIAFPSADQTIAYAVMRDGVPVVQRTVIIVVVDTTPPFFVFMPPALVLEAATLPRPATLVSNIAVHDAVDGDITPLPTAIRVDTSGVVLDEPGQYSALYWSDVTDAAGNALPPTPRTVIVADTMPPVLAAVFAGVPFAWNTTVMHEGATPFPYPTVTATDALDGAIPPASINRTDTPVAVAAAGPAGASVRVSYSVRDAAGNTAVEGFTVIIVDTTPPVIETPRTGQRVHVLFGSDAVRRVRVDIRAVDAVDGDVSSLAVVVLPTSPPIDTHVPGAHPVRIRARDNSGNTQAVGITLVIDPLVPPARKRRVLVVAVETRPRAPLQMLERELEQTLDLNANTAVILSATDPATTAASSDISDASINSSGKTGLSAGSVLFEVGVRMNAMSAAWRDLQFLRDRLRNLHTLNGTRVLFSRVGNMTTYPSQPPSSSSSSSSSQSAAVIAGTAGALAFVCIVTTVVIGLRRRMAGAKSTVHTLPPSPTAAATTTTPTAAEGVVGSSVCRLERNPAYEESSITMNFNPLYMPTHVMGQEAMIDESSSDAEPHYNTLRLPTRTHTAKTNSVQYDTLGASRTTAANCADDDEDGNYIEVSQGVEGDDEAEEVVGFAIPGTADVNQEQPVYTDMTPASLSGLDAAGEYVVPARGDTEETVYSTAHTSTATSADISGVCILDNTARYHATKHDGGRQTLQR
ncbi:hypothetical protein PTSG_10516 [Salpingoeca rosetta]|uniref:TNFR-Cys domain-containing protein n=1 Tax=Salpingoeca rosetta (strain ATCC 50818 / BSB-021) TaxID=946362 RepID=F2UPW2_SALR5|nr:uncharacterized protein PTSG_10516 [Salpingoeca rosetta]EGD79667.1 hypothetical protein PTSG_10516 [Salpingoeca rosetta]|eukprot:XP_004988895.1 hypothetical protein PTSG_10516 [Salpingoeca rosetta]